MKRHCLTSICALCLFIVWSGCKKDEKPDDNGNNGKTPVIELPVITTLDVTDIMATTAVSGGNIFSDGGSAVVSRGVIWHTDSVLSLDTLTGYTIDGSGQGIFTSLMEYLQSNTEYYVCAYATNSKGTSYGNTILFKTNDTVQGPSLRDLAIQDYNDNYLGSMVSDPYWTGSVNGCVAGTISQDARQKILQRLNYFRRLVGLSDNVTENLYQHQGCQEAALIFLAQNNLSYYPPQSWKCWTQDGYNAASGSNIAWGTATSGEYCVHTTYGITGFMQNAGSQNQGCIYRSWFLMPGLTMLGIGSTNKTACMQWQGNYSASGPSPEFIAYPPAGYVPNQITFARWSFTLPTYADFSNANVTMTDSNGVSVPLNVVNKPLNQPGSWPLKHIVWEPQINPALFASDMKYTVTISGITGAPKSTYTYNVIVIPVTPGFKKTFQGETGKRKFM